MGTETNEFVISSLTELHALLETHAFPSVYI